jgi:hypothetical protein
MNDYTTIADKPIPTYHIGPQGPVATLRDQFAMAALPGMLSNPVTQEITEKTIKTIWLVADFMMEARK